MPQSQTPPLACSRTLPIHHWFDRFINTRLCRREHANRRHIMEEHCDSHTHELLHALNTAPLESYISQADSRIYCAANFSRGGEDCLSPLPCSWSRIFNTSAYNYFCTKKCCQSKVETSIQPATTLRKSCLHSVRSCRCRHTDIQ